MAIFSDCCSGFARLSLAAAKAASATFRAAGFGAAIDVHTRQARLTVCQNCPLAHIERGRVYCGRPLLRKIVREPSRDGCGCPVLPKSGDPTEHCPINRSHRAATTAAGRCDCRWCTPAASHRPLPIYSTSTGNSAA